MASFDANSFLDSQIQGGFSTQRILVEAQEYPAFIADIKSATGFSDKSQETWARLDLVFEIEDEKQKERTGRARILMTYGIMLELDENEPDGLARGKGKNVKLGKALEALGKNLDNFSPRELMHLQAKVQVKHEVYQNEPQEKIAGIRKM